MRATSIGEYPQAAERLEQAFAQAEEAGVLGDGVLGHDFSFHVHLYRGAGAYICGEETALIESLEGKRGEPRIRPPYPPQQGLWNWPTLVNNVETLANVPAILLKGAEHSPGTKIFLLLGDVVQRGAVEVPFGVTIRELIEHFGSGVRDGRPIKFVQMGGTAGTIVPPALMGLPLDYASAGQGISLSSGAMLVATEGTCVVEFGAALMRFFRHESCGKCTPCRISTVRALELLEGIAEGKGTSQDLLAGAAEVLAEGSLCGLGQSVAMPLRSLLEHFGNELREHIDRGGCANVH